MDQFDYYTFQTNMVIEKINEEIEFYENCEYAEYQPIQEYLEYLKNRLGKNKVDRDSYFDRNKRELKKMDLDKYKKDLDVMVFRRPWNKLKEIHRIMKIREYVDGLKFGEKCEPEKVEENKKYILDEICNGIRNKKLGKNGISYDPNKMTIVSISCLRYDKKTGLYEVKWK
ncbi:MAG: hypothetical protein QW303_01195 [Nitrososphaerota archaeon]